MEYWWNFPRYVTVAEKKAKAAKKLKQLRKKNPGIQPILLEGSAIARTWWGKSWNVNLERYADYRNRIGRGRSYVRHGAVLDLQIDSGKVESLVQGSQSKPYAVIIKIKAINKTIWQNIKTACEGKLDSLQELLAGRFPKALGEIFMAKGEGLFPSPKEIAFDCSCPDWADMCKHVAATLYAVGARLDDDPYLFFKLRKANGENLITQAVADKTLKLLKKAENKSSRVLATSDLSDVFGIEMEEDMDIGILKTTAKRGRGTVQKASPSTTRGKKSKGTKRKAGTKADLKLKGTRSPSPANSRRKTAKKTRAKTNAKIPAIRHTVKKNPSTTTDIDQVLTIVRRSKKGVTVPILKKRTGLDEKKIRNIVYSAFRKGTIRRAGRGIYLRA